MNRAWSCQILKTYLMVLSMFVSLGYGITAIAAEFPSFTATAGGTTKNLTLSTNLYIADADVGQTGNIYLGFNFNQHWFFNNGSGWDLFNGGSVPSYATGPLTSRTIDIVSNANMSGLVGGQLYAAYGLTEGDMLTNGKFGLVYTVFADTTPPTVTDTGAPNGATGLAVNRSSTAIFSEAMDPLTINTATFTVKQGTTPVAGTVNYVGTTATFKPAADLAFNTTYTSTVTTGAKDLSGNPMASDFVWSWTIGAAPDTTAPTVTGTIHANGATNVAVNTKAGITFSEGMDPATITNANFTLQQTSNGNAIAGTVSYAGVNAVFTPSSNLAYSTGYRITVKGGISGVKDLAGNPLASDFVISWTTGIAPDITRPTVTDTLQVNGAINVAINTKVGVTFSEGMDPLTITNLNFTLKQASTGDAVTGTVSDSGVNAVFTPLNNLAFSTRYTATVRSGMDGAKDLAGNPLANDFVWSWTTGAAPDTTAPTVTGTLQANGATDVAINTKVGVTFSEAMDPLTITNLNFALMQTATGDAVAGTVSYTGVNAVFTPLNNLAFSTGYTATVKSGTSGAWDLAGNPLASDYAWSWTTGAAPDTTAPTVVSNSPLANSTIVTLDAPITVTFIEAMDPLTLTTATIQVATKFAPIAAIVGTVTYSAGSKMATFTPTSGLPNGRTITATVTSGVKDLAGNALVSDFIWTFYVQKPTIEPPTVISTAPAGNATNVAVSSTVAATFNTAMDASSITTANYKLTGPGTTPVTGTVATNGATATFTPAASLAGNTLFTATISGGKNLAGTSLASPVSWTFTTSNLPLNPTAPTLGEAGRFVILASQAVTTTTGSVISNGDIGIIDIPRTGIAGFTPTGPAGDFTNLTNGTSFAPDDANPAPFPYPLKFSTLPVGAAWATTGTMITQVRTDLGIADTFLAADPNPGAATQVSPIELGNLTLTRGVYRSASNIGITTGPLRLDAQGDANSVFIIVTGGTLTTGASGSIVLVNQAQAKNVYWRSAGLTIIAAGTTFYGNVFAVTQVNVLAGANVTGRLFARTDRVTLISDTVTKAP